MLVTDPSAALRVIETNEDFAETRLEAVGFVFHGAIPGPDGKKPRVKAGTNLLHFARCSKLDRVAEGDQKMWYRSIRVAKAHLDEHVGPGRWGWCKTCQREVTQRVLNEA
jgi:hypothetical protein